MRSLPIKPESVRVRDRILSVCSHGECTSHRIWDFAVCWQHLTIGERQNLQDRVVNALRAKSDLSKLILTGADLSGIDFTGANLEDAFLNETNLTRCRFVDSNLKRAFLANANLSKSDLTRAELAGTVFTGANLTDVTLLAYSLSYNHGPVNLKMSSFGKDARVHRPHINEKDSYFAEYTYRALKRYFLNNGDYDSASWASYSERLMQTRNLFHDKKYLSWSISALFGGICGFGEKPLRVFFTAIVIILVFSGYYQIFNVILQPSDSSPWVNLYFSIATFSGFSFADIVLRSDSFSRALVTTEAFLGVFVIGLFVFTLTKRFVAR